MEKLIETVLEELRDTNLHSAAGRQAVVRAIMKKIRSKTGWYLNMNTIDGGVPEVGDKEEEAKWVCEHCDESTFEVDYDYIGSNYNHLQCDLKGEEESKEKNETQNFTFDLETGDWVDQHGNREETVEITQTIDVPMMPPMPQPQVKKVKHFANDFHEGRDGDNNYVYSGDLKDAQQQAYNELSADGLPPGGDAQATRDANKLAEEIAGGSVDLGYIFESPDGGETIYRRKVGESERELISKENWKEYNRNRQGVKIHDTKK